MADTFKFDKFEFATFELVLLFELELLLFELVKSVITEYYIPVNIKYIISINIKIIFNKHYFQFSIFNMVNTDYGANQRLLVTYGGTRSYESQCIT